MNPFDLHGFAFLAFYLFLGTATLWGLSAWIRLLETADTTPPQNMSDPYLIAHLRAGPNEAMRVATVALIDRGLLDANDGTLSTRNADAVELAQRPIEKAILKRYLSPGKSYEVFKDGPTQDACRGYEKILSDHGMIASNTTFAKRLPWAMIAAVFLLLVAFTKIDMALSEGRHNVGFLFVLAGVFTVLVGVVWRKRRTRRGDAMLKDLRALFARLKGRANALRAGGQTNEAALLAGVFGVAALPALIFPFTRKLYPSQAGSGSSCGSSCSSGSSCGGGCGGGGCGG